MTIRSWIDTVSSDSDAAEKEARCETAMGDLMACADGPIQTTRIDGEGVLHLTLPPALLAKNPRLHATSPHALPSIRKNPQVNDTRALVIWLDHDYYDPQATLRQFNGEGKKSRVDRTALVEAGITNARDYAYGAIEEELQAFASAISSQVYKVSNGKIAMPLVADWVAYSHTSTGDTPPSAVVLMTDKAHENLLQTAVKEMLQSHRERCASDAPCPPR